MNSDDNSNDRLQRVLDDLTPREREVLKKRFGIEVGSDVTLAEVVKQFDLTRERIREVERRARDKRGGGDDPDDAA